MDEETFMNKKMRRFEGLLNNSYPLLDFMAQTINKCSDEILQKRLKDQFRKRLDDFVFDQTVIDKSSLDIIAGSTVDYKKEMIGASFVIKNPQASASCGCGLSFSV